LARVIDPLRPDLPDAAFFDVVDLDRAAQFIKPAQSDWKAAP
jgi:hypothetical protein